MVVLKVRQLEEIVIRWTKQIKALLSDSSEASGAKGAGPGLSAPLQEIEHWRLRSLDLNGVREQLQGPGGCRCMYATLLQGPGV
jgi:hypothetical protein